MRAEKSTVEKNLASGAAPERDITENAPQIRGPLVGGLLGEVVREHSIGHGETLLFGFRIRKVGGEALRAEVEAVKGGHARTSAEGAAEPLLAGINARVVSLLFLSFFPL